MVLSYLQQDIENHLRQLADKIRTEEEKHDNMAADMSDEEFEGRSFDSQFSFPPFLKFSVYLLSV